MSRRKTIMWIILAVLAVFIAVNFVRIYSQNSRIPSLGVTNGQLKEVPKTPNAVSTQTLDLAKKVAPLPFKHDPESTMAAIIATVNKYGGAKIVKQERDYLYVVFTTPLMKFHDDAEFYLDETNRLVHFRSASRAGYSDLGLNQKRYTELKEYYLMQ